MKVGAKYIEFLLIISTLSNGIKYKYLFNKDYIILEQISNRYGSSIGEDKKITVYDLTDEIKYIIRDGVLEKNKIDLDTYEPNNWRSGKLMAVSNVEFSEVLGNKAVLRKCEYISGTRSDIEFLNQYTTIKYKRFCQISNYSEFISDPKHLRLILYSPTDKETYMDYYLLQESYIERYDGELISNYKIEDISIVELPENYILDLIKERP